MSLPKAKTTGKEGVESICCRTGVDVILGVGADCWTVGYLVRFFCRSARALCSALGNDVVNIQWREVIVEDMYEYKAQSNIYMYSRSVA